MLKSTGSAFEGFIRDEYTTLPEVNDRIFSTSVDLLYTFAPFEITAPKDDKKLEFDKEQIEGAGGLGAWEGVKVSECAREMTLSVFALDESASVQVRFNPRCRRIKQNNITKTGDIVQNGARINQRERGGESCDIHPSKQTLHPG